ncbi:GntR family transcriptional regulator [Roseibium sp. CAU 1637]|uniref:GntR family transcriptional regulator n=1 Tax=Roseibium limicola TaxID=2816037 RepID=A0A939EMD5_9HYPH|nr:GntR family transcriptional regulator [Roseibium limicola]MBO0345370.1 GntR family transcriptional regulator [Roseibium limicola]
MKSYDLNGAPPEAYGGLELLQEDTGGRASSDERVLITLRRHIMDGSIPSGEKITEVGLAGLLEVSRTPVRLALRALEVEGLIKKRSGRGYTVVDFDFDDTSNAYQVRGVLEGLAARCLAENGMSEEVDGILRRSLEMTRDALDHLRDKKDSGMDLYQEANTLFHETIMRECGNSFVPFTYTRLETVPLLKLGVLVFNHDSYDTEVQRLTIGYGQHLIVYDAIAKGDAARAEAMMREHSHATITYSMLFSR